jgi:LAO/AO transport system kinase
VRRPLDAAAAAELLDRARGGDLRATASLLFDVESGGLAALEALGPFGPLRAVHRIGITGVPGAGKSTLTSQLIQHLRERGMRVAVLAVDPSSPFTGGAVLGDRLRMQQHAADPGVFIRSMATRGQLGGLARATNGVARVLECLGYDAILIETVGVGQDEVDIAEATHTTLVVLVPGLGDDVQSLKAGVMEIGDAVVVNKADRPGSEDFARQVRSTLSLSRLVGGSPPPVFSTVSTLGTGLDRLVAWVVSRIEDRGEEFARRDERRRRGELRAEVEHRVRIEAELRIAEAPGIEAAVVRGDLTPREAATRIVPSAG